MQGGSLLGLTHPLNEPRILGIQAGTEKITDLCSSIITNRGLAQHTGFVLAVSPGAEFCLRAPPSTSAVNGNSSSSFSDQLVVLASYQSRDRTEFRLQ